MHRISLIFAIIGALNWGSIGIFQFNVITALFGRQTSAANILFIIIGLAGIRCITLLFLELEIIRTYHRD